MAQNTLGSNPFNPGMASSPLYVAGREEELCAIDNVLESISLGPKEQRRTMGPVLIMGPARTGKTTLLLKALERAEQLGFHVAQTAALKPLKRTTKLMRDLMGKEKAMQSLVKRLDKRHEGWFYASWSQELKREVVFEEVLLARLRSKPVLLVLDDAMHHDLEALASVLRVFKSLQFLQRPLALIIAGTPGIEHRLEQAVIDFIFRCRILSINTLSTAEARDALAKPFELRGAGLSESALRHMVKLTGKHPFFIQIAGQEVWKAMRAVGKRKASLAEVQAAEKEIDRAITEFYELVYSEIADAELLGHASGLMRVLAKNKGKLPHIAVLSVLAGKKMGEYSQEQVQIMHQLVDRGFICGIGGSMFSSGIPSFFDYCKERGKKRKAGSSGFSASSSGAILTSP